ncbi:uncharacterized protein [Symphalangus syndactylus]|uniref:uncharacterized protein n=1 Tax=Symphalangus syndactylus TaxID=9590 RepID=UPI00300564DC
MGVAAGRPRGGGGRQCRPVLDTLLGEKSGEILTPAQGCPPGERSPSHGSSKPVGAAYVLVVSERWTGLQQAGGLEVSTKSSQGVLVATGGRIPGQLGQTGHRTRGSLTRAPCGGTGQLFPMKVTVVGRTDSPVALGGHRPPAPAGMAPGAPASAVDMVGPRFMPRPSPYCPSQVRQEQGGCIPWAREPFWGRRRGVTPAEQPPSARATRGSPLPPDQEPTHPHGCPGAGPWPVGRPGCLGHGRMAWLMDDLSLLLPAPCAISAAEQCLSLGTAATLPGEGLDVELPHL